MSRKGCKKYFFEGEAYAKYVCEAVHYKEIKNGKWKPNFFFYIFFKTKECFRAFKDKSR